MTPNGATFSPCRVYRYALWRGFDSPGPFAAFIGLNPSTADETVNDPTVRRCINFAKSWGFERFVMLNAFGFRATLPADMKAASDPVGPGNDAALALYGKFASVVVAAWGVHCEPWREHIVLNAVGRDVWCLGRNQNGTPKHPLYLRADKKLEVYSKS